jgi:PAS domain S-box-containing protein
MRLTRRLTQTDTPLTHPWSVRVPTSPVAIRSAALLAWLRATRTRRVMVAVVAVIAMAGLREAMQPLLHAQGRLIPFVAAVAAAAVVGGLAYGLLATILSAVVGWYAFEPPGFSWRIDDPAWVTYLALFVLICLLVSALCDRLLASRELVEQALRRYRVLVEGAHHLIAIRDARGSLVYMNPTWTRYTGLPVSEAVGDSAVHPDDRASLEQARREGLAHRQPWSAEIRLRRADGAWRWWRLRSWPDLGPDGDALAWQGIAVDIHEQREMQQALARSERLFRLKVELSPFPTVVAGRDGRIVLSNEAHRREFGIGPGDMAHIDLRAPGPEVHPAVAAALVRAYAGEATAVPLRTEVIPLGERRGQMVSLRTFVFPLTNASGEVEEVVIINDDVSEVEQARQRLRIQADELARSNAELEQFAYIASHDLQEPTRMVASYLQLIERRVGADLDETARRHLAAAITGARRMHELVRSVLDYSRIGKGEPGEVELDQALAAARADLQDRLEAAGAVIEVAPLPRVRGEASELARLLRNLISNAVKFRSAAPPRIRIAAEAFDGAWRISVTDNGIGIAPDEGARLFGLFQRLHSEDAYPGTGIGLAACKKIVEHLGGRIWFEPAPGGGTVFRFTLPEPGHG